MMDAACHAYVDRQLPADQLQAVWQWWVHHPEDALRVQARRAQSVQLKELQDNLVLIEAFTLPFEREAMVAHKVFVPEVRHPVEVGAAEEAHLVQWLSRRLSAPLRVPSLQAQGFRLLGGAVVACRRGADCAVHVRRRAGRAAARFT